VSFFLKNIFLSTKEWTLGVQNNKITYLAKDVIYLILAKIIKLSLSFQQLVDRLLLPFQKNVKIYTDKLVNFSYL